MLSTSFQRDIIKANDLTAKVRAALRFAPDCKDQIIADTIAFNLPSWEIEAFCVWDDETEMFVTEDAADELRDLGIWDR